MSMSGSVAANAFLGQTSSATETFHLEQEFEIECSDSATCLVRLTLESALVGFVRSKHKAGAGVKVASAKDLRGPDRRRPRWSSSTRRSASRGTTPGSATSTSP